MPFRKIVNALAAAAALLASQAGAVDNGLAITPQMGCTSHLINKTIGSS
jgi:hypothetical protein